jgi:hypothetical protein
MNRPDVGEKNDIVAWLILGYLCSHPDAKDTAEGIGKWWLHGEGMDVGAQAVRLSLDYLVELGWLIAVTGYSGSRMYGLNQERKALLQQFLHRQASCQ